MVKCVAISFLIVQIAGIILGSDPSENETNELQSIFKDDLPEKTVESYSVRLLLRS